MNKEYLVSDDLMKHYEYMAGQKSAFECRELEQELEEERQEALKKAPVRIFESIENKLALMMREDKKEDCTEIIRQNLLKMKISKSDQRRRNLSFICNKYIKTEEEDNLFTMYMKKQVCAELPEASRLIDLVYKVCSKYNGEDRLNAINEAVYKSFIEYLGTRNILFPCNAKHRCKSDRILNDYGTYGTNSGSRSPDVTVKNTMQQGNITVSCVSYPCVFPNMKGIPSVYPVTSSYTMSTFVKYVLNYSDCIDISSNMTIAKENSKDSESLVIKVSPSHPDAEIRIGATGCNSFRSVYDLYSSSGIPRFLSSGTELITSVITEINEDDYRIKVCVNNAGINSYRSPDWTTMNSGVITLDKAMDTGNNSDDMRTVCKSLSDGLTSLLHRLIRKDHALEDMLNVFMYLLGVENNKGLNTEENPENSVIFLGHKDSIDSRNAIVKAVMAAIVAPVKKTTSKFNVAPDLSTIAEISGMTEKDVAMALYRFGSVFGLEFFASSCNDNSYSASCYHDNLFCDMLEMNLFSKDTRSPSNMLTYNSMNDMVAIMRPRLKKLIVSSIARNEASLDYKEILNALTMSFDEALCLEKQFVVDSVVRPALAFYLSVVSTVVYIIGHKAASLLPYYFKTVEAGEKGFTTFTELNSIVYGMGTGLIHAVFSSKTPAANYACDMAIPISQYIVPDIAGDFDDTLDRLSSYLKDLSYSLGLLEHHLKRSGRMIKLYLNKEGNGHLKEMNKHILDNIGKLPDFRHIRTLYISDPDCINVFAPAFRGVYKPGDRAVLEEKFAEVRKKVEEIYYVIAGRRPLVSEEYMEDRHHSITMAVNGDRENIDLRQTSTLYSRLIDQLGVEKSRALATPDPSVISLDARALRLISADDYSDVRISSRIARKYLSFGVANSRETSMAFDLFVSCILKIKGSNPALSKLKERLVPAIKNMAIKYRRRSYPLVGFFVESDRWSIASKYAGKYVCSPYPPVYQVLDKRNSGDRLPILALPEYSCAYISESVSNTNLNSAGDIPFMEESNTASYCLPKNVIPNQVMRMTADSSFLSPYTNYRFLEAERRRWNLQKYPEYQTSSYIKFARIPAYSTSDMWGSPFDKYLDYQTFEDTDLGDMTRTSKYLDKLTAASEAAAEYEKRAEAARSRLLEKAKSNTELKDEREFGQIWLEDVISKANRESSLNSSRLNLNILREEEDRQIALSFMDEYTDVPKLTIHTMVDTEDISKSINIYAEMVDAGDLAPSHIKSRMRALALMILSMDPPCTQEFLDTVEASDISEKGVNGALKEKGNDKYSAVCQVRELTKVASEIKVNATKISINKEMKKLRRQKEEYCKQYREYMATLKKQKKILNDSRCYLNNKDAFTEEEKGIESLYNDGRLLGYRLLCRRISNPLDGRDDGVSSLLDTNLMLKTKEDFLQKISSGNLAIDLVALTPPVYIWCGAFIFSIGKMTINIRDVFNSKNIKPRFYREDASLSDAYRKVGFSSSEIPAMIASTGMDAPHVRNHNACLGNLEENLSAAATEEDILAYLEWCMQYLNTVNLGDTFGAYLSYFPCVPATMHNVIKYGVLSSGRLDEKICLWTGAGIGDERRISPFKTKVVQPVWNISDDLAKALWKDAKRKLEDNMFEGSDINEDDLLKISAELSSKENASWSDANTVFRDILSYSLCKGTQQEPGTSLGHPGGLYVSDPPAFSINLRAGLRQKLEHREYYMKRALDLMEYTERRGISFGSIWKSGMDPSLQVNLNDVRQHRLSGYNINIGDEND